MYQKCGYTVIDNYEPYLGLKIVLHAETNLKNKPMSENAFFPLLIGLKTISLVKS
jgi:hypothetical protein